MNRIQPRQPRTRFGADRTPKSVFVRRRIDHEVARPVRVAGAQERVVQAEPVAGLMYGHVALIPRGARAVRPYARHGAAAELAGVAGDDVRARVDDREGAVARRGGLVGRVEVHVEGVVAAAVAAAEVGRVRRAVVGEVEAAGRGGLVDEEAVARDVVDEAAGGVEEERDAVGGEGGLENGELVVDHLVGYHCPACQC